MTLKLFRILLAKSGAIVYIMVQYLPLKLTAVPRGHYHYGEMTAPLH